MARHFPMAWDCEREMLTALRVEPEPEGIKWEVITCTDTAAVGARN